MKHALGYATYALAAVLMAAWCAWITARGAG